MRRELTDRWRSWVGVGVGCFWVLTLVVPTEAAGDGRVRRPGFSDGAEERQVEIPRPFIVRLTDTCRPAKDQAVARGVGARYGCQLGVVHGFRAWMTPGQAARLEEDSRV